jgi:hypothetical protein
MGALLRCRILLSNIFQLSTLMICSTPTVGIVECYRTLVGTSERGEEP